MKIADDKITSLLLGGVESATLKDSLEKKIKSGKPLRVKFGIDPTSPDLHLGHAVILRKLREFQELGHKIIFLIGDFTAMIGDPSGRSETRKPLSAYDVKKNMKDYSKEAGKIINLKKTKVFYNSKWYSQMKLGKVLELLGMASLNQILEREDFSNRYKSGQSIGLNELLYPIMQAYDSVIVKADVELGGTDQTFNLLTGRRLMSRMGLEPQDIITMPLLEGTDGDRKMSKSYGNYIALSDSPNEMFGKAMSLRDGLVKKYFSLTTDLRDDEVENILKSPPIDAKERLAFEIVKIYHGAKKAELAKKFFRETFREKKLPEDIPVVKFRSGEKLGDILISKNIVSSSSELRRLVNNGAVEFDQKPVESHVFQPQGEGVLRIGKKKFIRLSPVK